MSQDKQGIGLAPGTRIGKYEVVGIIGSGGQSVVYKCYDALLDRHVAAKQISSHLATNPGFLEQFRREARILAKFGAEQPGIVTIHDLIENEHGLFIVMEYVEGKTLEALMVDSGAPMDVKPAVQLLWRLAGALAAVHHGGIVHRDLKPSNVIVTEGMRPKITDFGVATSMSGQTSMLLGTTKYMAPELFEGGVADARCDIYSLGVMLYELLLGRDRFNDIFAEVVRDPRTASVRWMKWHGNPRVVAPALREIDTTIPAELSRIVAKMMAKNPDERFASMEILGGAIHTELARQQAAEKMPVGHGGDMESSADRTPVSEGPAPAAPTSPTRAELEEAPTMPLPARMTSKQRNIILASVAGGVVLLVLVAMLVFSQSQARDIRQAAEAKYLAAASAYQDDEDYATAATLFAEVAEKYPSTLQGEKCVVLAPLAACRAAVEAQDWQTAREQGELADVALIEFDRSKGEKMDPWIAARREEMDQLEAYRKEQRRYTEAMDAANQLIAARRYDEAVYHIQSEVRGMLLSEAESDAIKAFLANIYRLRVEDRWGELAREIEGAIEEHNYIEAGGLSDEIEVLLESDDIDYIPAGQLAEWDQQRIAWRNRINRQQAIDQWEAQLAQEIRNENKRGELEARRFLLKLAIPDSNDAAAHAERIAKLEIDITYEEALAFFNDGNLLRASDLAVTIADDPRAAALLKKISELSKLEYRLKEADTLFGQGQWEQAKAIFEEVAAEHITQATPAVLERVVIRIKDCDYQIALLLGDAARASGTPGDLVEARRFYQEAARLDPTRAAMDVDPRLADIDRLERLADIIVEGDELLEAAEWSDARRKFAEGLDECITIGETNLIEERMDMADYGRYLAMGIANYQERNYSGAIVWFDKAKEFKNTDELQEWRAKAAQAEIDAKSD